MRILLLTHAFNSLTQRLYVELAALGHELSVELDINDAVTQEAVDLFRPDLIIAPFLKRAIPEAIWRQHICLVVHPGIVGDRGPSALDWAIMDGESVWGVTLLQAEAEMDAGPVWAAETFPMRPAKKSSLYRNEVTESAVRAVLEALDRLPDYRAGRWRPTRLDEISDARGRLRAPVRQSDRAIDWEHDQTSRVLTRIRAADGFPGVQGSLFGVPCRLFDARTYPARGRPGELVGRCGDGLVRATADGAVWIGQVRRLDGHEANKQPIERPTGLPIKLPAAVAFPESEALEVLDELPVDPIRYLERDGVGYLHFDFYNGAMGTAACERLLEAYCAVRERPVRVLVLMGGADFFSNGLDLNRIEAAASPADESMRNIEAMDELCRTLIETEDRVTVACLRGNAGAGGAFLALAADRVWARAGVVLNPHYKNMGNLYGSEYWTYRLPGRVGGERAAELMSRRLPLGAAQAEAMGFIDACLDGESIDAEIERRAGALAASASFDDWIAEKRRRRAADESARPLADYRADELAHMRRNFYGFDPSYHVARHHFVHRTPHSWTPRHLARHRELGWRVPEG